MVGSASEAERTAVVFTGGDPLAPELAELIPPDALVIAADSGIEQAMALGCAIDVAVGDFDSVSPEALAAAEHAGAEVERHPVAKDATDLELALSCARERGATRVLVLGGHGGRVDHFVANVLLLGSAKFSGMHVEALIGPAQVTVIREGAELNGEPGDVLSLLAVGGRVDGVTTCGLVYPLNDEPLYAGSTRGVSNVFAQPTATIRVRGGTLIAVQPRPFTEGTT